MSSIIGFTAAHAALGAEKPGHLEWTVTENRGSELQLEVRQLPLERVLQTLSAKTGVPIHYSVVPEGSVTATCVGSTLKQVMECLLARKADLVIRYYKPSPQSRADVSGREQPAEMWVLGSRFTAAPDCTNAVSGQRTINNAPLETADSQSDAIEEEPDPAEELLRLAKSNDAVVRADAIGALLSAGRQGDGNVKRVLEEALKDPDARVRAQAISSLARREGDAATAALQEALRDADAEVRLMAVDAAGNDAALLQQAVNDGDETVRELAISKLQELQKTVKR